MTALRLRAVVAATFDSLELWTFTACRSWCLGHLTFRTGCTLGAGGPRRTCLTLRTGFALGAGCTLRNRFAFGARLTFALPATGGTITARPATTLR